MTEFATSETGARKETKLARYDLIPTVSLRFLAEAYGKGLEKYPTEPGRKDNWRNGYSYSLSYAALQRHVNAYWSGEEIDEETGCHHLALACFHAFSLMHWGNDPELDERYDDRQDPEWVAAVEYEEWVFGAAKPRSYQDALDNIDRDDPNYWKTCSEEEPCDSCQAWIDGGRL